MYSQLARLLRAVTRLSRRVRDVLEQRADRQVTAWAASLQYKRRYTNPDEAKRYRQMP